MFTLGSPRSHYIQSSSVHTSVSSASTEFCTYLYYKDMQTIVILWLQFFSVSFQCLWMGQYFHCYYELLRSPGRAQWQSRSAVEERNKKKNWRFQYGECNYFLNNGSVGSAYITQKDQDMDSIYEDFIERKTIETIFRICK